MFSDTLSAIEVGTSRTVCIIGRPGKDGRVEVVAASTNEMTGLRKGQVVNAPNVRTGISTALASIARKEPLPEKNNWLVFSGGNAGSGIVFHSILTAGTITPTDIETAVSGAATGNRLEKRTILHSVPQDYVLNEKQTVEDPTTMSADSLRANVLLIHCDETPLTNMRTVVQDSHLSIRGHIFSAACAGRAVLSDEQRCDGVLLINLGAGTTSYARYGAGVLRSAGSIPVGGDHVSNDIARAFNIPFRAAESCKCEYSSARIGDAAADETVPVAASGMLDQERRLPLRDVNTVVNARIDETLRIVLKLAGPAGDVVLVGGGALQKGILDVAELVFGCPCAIGAIRDGTHFDKEGRLDPLFATAYGALYIALDELKDIEKNKKQHGFFDALFGRGNAK